MSPLTSSRIIDSSKHELEDSDLWLQPNVGMSLRGGYEAPGAQIMSNLDE